MIKKIIFYADDNIYMRNTIRETLNDKYEISTYKDGQLLLDAITNGSIPHVILLDIQMPLMDGFETAAKINELNHNIPIIAVSGFISTESYEQLFKANFYDAIQKPFSFHMLKRKIENALKESKILNFEKAEEIMITTFANLEELRDPLTKGHNDRVSKIVASIATAMKFDETMIQNLKLAAMLHDVGKHGITENILNKTTKLSDNEFDMIKRHTIKGKTILEPLSAFGIDSMILAEEIAFKHHEKLDGSGYPIGMTKNDIPEYVRIVTIADIYDAIVSERPYHPRRAHSEGILALQQDVMNGKLDNEIFKVFKSFPNFDN
jgi:response regulator RpfG family c-di-GMP phosphodiesterase